MIPGFFAERSFFHSEFCYSYAEQNSSKKIGMISPTQRYIIKNYRNNSQSIILQKNKWLSDQKWQVPEPASEPSQSGRRAWRDLERACNNLQCQKCRNDCVTFVHGLHDSINIKLGKPMRTPNDFVYLRDFLNAMSKYAFSHDSINL